MNKRIAFLYVAMNSFTLKDLNILKSKYSVRPLRINTLKEMCIGLLKIREVDALFCWFGSIRFLPHVILARVLQKKVVIVSGGYDAASVPHFIYGNMYKKYKHGIPRILGKFMFRLADKVLCVSDSNCRETVTNVGVPLEKIITIKHGFEDFAEAYPDKLDLTCKDNVVITVGRINHETLLRKGLLRAAKVSKYLSGTSFVFIGGYDSNAYNILRLHSGKNVEFAGFVTDQELCEYFLKAKVYIQLSEHEAFGCSVAEAMLFGCVPVVSDKYALPEVVGHAGFCVDPDDTEKVVWTVEQILNGKLIPEESPRQRILQQFSLDKRAEQLLSTVEDVLERH